MTSRAIAVLLQTRAWAAEQECDRWLKLVDREVGERKEALGEKAGAARAKIEEPLARTSGRVVEARAACRAGKDKTATVMAIELWDAFVEEERQEGALSLNSRTHRSEASCRSVEGVLSPWLEAGPVWRRRATVPC